ncbi:MAG: hypothetical protein KatS3mg109_1485 [Pirellulaceae bacterium]|nr:MAG: hypothetical protein KatS3mg109_1485 [Pirellulaceae bacterium]GIW96219.1 MAG: hypothetical protein KatS3mg110_4260 [Pirellulaceae bacterium]
MITTEIRERIKELWAQDYSQRAIARTLCISRDSVRRVLIDLTKNGLQDAGVGARHAERLGTAQRPRPVLRTPSQKIGRCRTCAALVYLPCLACQIRRWHRVREKWPDRLPEPICMRGRGSRS